MGSLFGGNLLGFIGCGTGIVADYLVSNNQIKVPNEINDVKKRIHAILDPFYETALASALKEDIIAIQIWHMRKKL